MKKKKQQKSQSRQRVQRNTVKPLFLFPFPRFIITTTSIALFIAVVVTANRHTVMQSVQGVSIVRGMFAEATISLPSISEAVKYNIYYSPTSDSGFSDAVRDISATETAYTIQYLKKNTMYKYEIAAVDSSGKEFWFSPVSIITNLQGM